MTSDRDLKEAVVRALAGKAHIDDTAIGVAVHGGIVTLSGTVHSWEIKHAVEEAARAAPGVRDLANDIVFEYRSCAARCDATMVASLRAALAEKLDARQIRLVVDDHSVTLTGSVANPEERQRANAIARACRGVLDVEDQLAVRPD